MEVPSQLLVITFEKWWRECELPGTPEKDTKYIEIITKKWGSQAALEKYWEEGIKEKKKYSNNQPKPHKTKPKQTQYKRTKKPTLSVCFISLLLY